VDRSRWEQEKENGEKESLERHARLHRLFTEDRLAFERERKTMIDRFLHSVEDQDQRDRLRALQENWDKKMRHAGSRHNRFVLAQKLFWDHFFQVWNPGIQEASRLLNKRSDPIRS